MHMKKKNPQQHDDGSSGGGYPIPLNSTTEALVSLIVTINFIGCCLQGIEHNILERCNVYIFATKKLFRKIPVKIPKPPSPKEKTSIIITYYWRWLLYKQIKL